MQELFVAHLNNVRVTPRKVRLLADLIRGKNVTYALDQLRLLKKRSAPMVAKLIGSAIANAQNKATVDVDRLVVKEIFVGHAVTWKRFIPRAKGQASGIKKRGSRITVKLAEK